jgi:hypothetical protein
MARLARIVVPDVAHHVTQRSNRRQEVFFSDEDYAAYRELSSVDISLPIFDANDVQWGGHIWEVSIGPPGLGGGIAYYPTDTVVQSGGCTG